MARQQIIRTVQPKISRTGRVTCVTQKELLLPNMSTSATFTTIFSANINPGNDKVFPWLSQIAAQYEMYRFKRLSFVYRPYSAVTSNGLFYLMPDYDASDPDPSSEYAVVNHNGCVITPPWNTASLHFDIPRVDAFTKRRFIRAGLIAGDLKTYDVGRLFIASNNATATGGGQLWVEYECELYVPTLDGVNKNARLTNKTVARKPAVTQVITSGATARIQTAPLTLVDDGLRLLDWSNTNTSQTVYTVPQSALQLELEGQMNSTADVNALLHLYQSVDGVAQVLKTYSIDGLANDAINFGMKYLGTFAKNAEVYWELQNLGTGPINIDEVSKYLSR